jgi:hypothetical protein
MNNKQIALMMLDSMILGIQSGSSIPIQLSELTTLKLLLTAGESASKSDKIPPPPPEPPATRVVRDDRKP